MRYTFTFWAGLLLVILFPHFSLANGSPQGDSAQTAPNQAPLSADSLSTDSADLGESATGRRYLKTIELQSQVADLGDAFKKIKELVLQFEGEIVAEAAQEAPTQIRLQLRIPNDKHEGFLATLHQLAAKEDRQANSHKDITLQLAELETRLRIKSLSLEEWLGEMANGKKNTDKSSARAAIQQLSEEMASIESQIAYWNNELSHTYFDVVIVPMTPETVLLNSTVQAQASQAFASGWHNALLLSMTLLSYWPICLLAVSIVAAYAVYARRARKRSEQRLLKNIHHLQQSITLQTH
jgi:hypothetical protein